MKTQWTLWVVGGLILLAFGLGVLSTYYTLASQPIGLGGLAVALTAVGVITFVGFYSRDGEIRGALAAATTLFYFALFACFLNDKVREALNNELGKQMISNLTALLTAVAAFYLGGKAVESVAKIREAGMTERQMVITPPPRPPST
jgi:hypothetical protein